MSDENKADEKDTKKLVNEKFKGKSFDERVKNGDTSIIPELAKWTKKEFGKNLFSFITKYCLYHNVHCYNKDDYAIFDSVVSKSLHKYISKEDYEILTGNKLRYTSFFKIESSSSDISLIFSL